MAELRRSQLGPGRKSLERGSTFERRVSEMKRSGPLKHGAPKRPANPHLAELNRRLAFLFHDSVQGRRCACCHDEDGYMHAHHCVERSFLETELEKLVTPERMLGIVWDPRNALGVGERCHGGHHGPSVRSPITRQHLPASAYEFAKEIDALVGDERFTVRLEAYPNTIKEAA